MRAALFLKQVGPAVAVACAVLAAAGAILFWRRMGVKARVGAVALAMIAMAAAWFGRVNVYEKMFHPIDAPKFEAAEQAQMDGDDMVIAVAMGRERRAYPVRWVAYHHIVNDTLGGEPIVATY